MRKGLMLPRYVNVRRSDFMKALLAAKAGKVKREPKPIEQTETSWRRRPTAPWILALWEQIDFEERSRA
jgi:hypothetical protein